MISSVPAYHTYGVAVPQRTAQFGKSDMSLVEQGELVKPHKQKNQTNGFVGFDSVDLVAMLITILLPQLIFAAVYALISFYLHYEYPTLIWTLILLIFAGVAFMGYVTISRMLKDADGRNDHQAVWAAAVFIGVNLAFFAALLYGYRNYGHNMQPYYERMAMNSYTDVDASTMGGRAFMDAGVVNFKAGSHLDLAKSTGFMNLNMYCIAPIVSPGNASALYDFWAVGINCCTGASQNFACGHPSKTDLTGDIPWKTDLTGGGLRLLSASELPFFQLAVTQAATTYGIKSSHPIFVHWVQNTNAALSDYRTHGWGSFLPAQAFFSVFQLFVLIGAAMVVVTVKSRYQGKVVR